jgi:hypothetical protein
VVSKAYAHTAIKVTNDILRVIKPRGPGGFDFLSGTASRLFGYRYRYGVCTLLDGSSVEDDA